MQTTKTNPAAGRMIQPSANGANFTCIDLGPLSELHEYKLAHPRAGRVSGKVFVRESLKLTGMEVSINKLPAGISVPFYHQHKQNEELYLFIKGSGQMQIDDQKFNVREGSLVRIAPGGIRTWRNNSDADLYYIVVQAKADSLEQATMGDGIVVDKIVSWGE